jgi:hypothetical protein
VLQVDWPHLFPRIYVGCEMKDQNNNEMIKGNSLKETQPNLFELIVYQSLNEE